MRVNPLRKKHGFWGLFKIGRMGFIGRWASLICSKVVASPGFDPHFKHWTSRIKTNIEKEVCNMIQTCCKVPKLGEVYLSALSHGGFHHLDANKTCFFPLPRSSECSRIWSLHPPRRENDRMAIARWCPPRGSFTQTWRMYYTSRVIW